MRPMHKTYHTLFSLTFSLFLLMDAFGNVPIYISLLKNIPYRRQLVIIIRELLIALFVIIFFTFVGNYLLDLIHIEPDAILIAGGVILFMIAIKMIFPQPREFDLDPFINKGEPFIVPLAIPLVAGPSVLAAVMIYSHQQNDLILITAICLAWIFSTLILISAPFLQKALGKRGVDASARLMGLLMTLISVQMFLDGIRLFIHK